MLPFIAVTALGLIVAGLLDLWLGLFQNRHVAIAVWVAACVAFGFIYDRRQARKRRDTRDFRPPRE